MKADKGSGFSCLSKIFSSSSDSSSSLSNLQEKKYFWYQESFIPLQKISNLFWHPLFVFGGNCAPLMKSVFSNSHLFLWHKPLFGLKTITPTLWQHPWCINYKPLAFYNFCPSFWAPLLWRHMGRSFLFPSLTPKLRIDITRLVLVCLAQCPALSSQQGTNTFSQFHPSLANCLKYPHRSIKNPRSYWCLINNFECIAKLSSPSLI